MRDKIIILMATYNGEKYIEEQIESIKRQTEHNWTLYVWDDGSTDTTLIKLHRYEDEGVLKVVSTKRVGYPNVFYNLLTVDSEGGYYAFSDQDDIWLPEKLETAKKRLENETEAALYCSKKYIVDNDLNVIGDDREVEYGFFNAMFKANKASGCTMVINRSLYKKIIMYRPRSEYAPYHDSWCYKLAVIFGKIYYDRRPSILYRQHAGNTVGASKTGWKLLLHRIKKFDYSLKRYRNNYGTSNYASEILHGYKNEIPEMYFNALRDIRDIRYSKKSRIRLLRADISITPFYEYVVVKILLILGWM